MSESSFTHPRPPAVSFEFFPPADAAAERALAETVARLAPLAPSFVSVTCGALGSTRGRTFEAVARIARGTGLNVAPHVTCIDADRTDIELLGERYWALGVRHIVALRGDVPTAPGVSRGKDGYAFAANLVAGLREVRDFEISVAGYPQTHPEASSPKADIEHLKAKCDAGAARVITQFFFEADDFLRFRDRCVAAGIAVPIVAGVLPVARFGQLLRFAARCGLSVPGWLACRFERLDEDAPVRELIAASVAIELVDRLRREGVDEFHIYTLNRSELTYAICHHLGLRSATSRRAGYCQVGDLGVQPGC